MPRRLHSPTTCLPSVRQALMLRRLGLDIADRVAGVVHELQMTNAQLVGGLDAAGILLDEARPFHRQHDVGRAAQRQIDVGRASARS